jgi:Cu(I)/Ag(I) efflux system membrane protein CusA/SilA
LARWPAINSTPPALLYLLGYNTSIAALVGSIALAGVAAETGVVTIVYLDELYDHRMAHGTMATRRDLYDAIIEGAVMRVRAKAMIVIAIIAASQAFSPIM